MIGLKIKIKVGTLFIVGTRTYEMIQSCDGQTIEQRILNNGVTWTVFDYGTLKFLKIDLTNL